MSLLLTWLFQLGRRRLLAGLPNAVLSADTDSHHLCSWLGLHHPRFAIPHEMVGLQ